MLEQHFSAPYRQLWTGPGGIDLGVLLCCIPARYVLILCTSHCARSYDTHRHPAYPVSALSLHPTTVEGHELGDRDSVSQTQ